MWAIDSQSIATVPPRFSGVKMDHMMSGHWLSDFDSILFEELDQNYLGDREIESIAAAVLEGDDHGGRVTMGEDFSPTSESNSSSTSTHTVSAASTDQVPLQAASKQMQHVSGFASASVALHPSLPILLDFSSGSARNLACEKEEDGDGKARRKRKASSRSSAGGQAREYHIIAERMRREKLSQKFIALAALIPGLKKMDKTSVLGEAIDLIKQQQQRLQKLEEESSRRTLETSRVSAEDDDDQQPHSPPSRTEDHEAPEVEARFWSDKVLLKIHCQKRRGTLPTLLAEIEKLHLFVDNINTMPFADSSYLEITIIAKMDLKFNMTPSDLVKCLNSALFL